MENAKYYELLGRINELEARISRLENEQSDQKQKGLVAMDTVNIEEKKMNKNELINNVKAILEPKLQEKNYNIRKATPKNGEGSGILLENMDDDTKNKKVMLKKSKDYARQYNFEDTYKYSGWFTVFESEFEAYDGYIFAIYKDNELTYFVFNKQEMQQLIKNKKMDSTGKYHFYIAEDYNGHYVDYRDGEMSVSKNVDAWNLLEDIVD